MVTGDVALTRYVGLGSNACIAGLWEKPVGLADGLMKVPAGTDPFDLPPIEVHTIFGRAIDEQQRNLTSGIVILAADKNGCGIAGIHADGTFHCETTISPDEFSVGTGLGTGPLGEIRAAVVISKTPLVIQMKAPADGTVR